MSNAKVAAVTLMGQKHKNREVPCEDYSIATEGNGVSVVVVSDGAGGKEYTHARFGSKATCEMISELLINHFDAIYNENREAAIKNIIIAAIHANMADAIEEMQLDSLDYAIINNIEIDHVDYFKDEIDYFNAYQEFVNQVKKVVVYNGEDDWCNKLDFKNLEHYSYGRTNACDFYTENLKEDINGTSYDLYHKGEYIEHFDLPFVGTHLLLDSLGVIVLSYVLKFNLKIIFNLEVI